MVSRKTNLLLFLWLHFWWFCCPLSSENSKHHGAGAHLRPGGAGTGDWVSVTSSRALGKVSLRRAWRWWMEQRTDSYLEKLFLAAQICYIYIYICVCDEIIKEENEQTKWCPNGGVYRLYDLLLYIWIPAYSYGCLLLQDLTGCWNDYSYIKATPIINQGVFI